MSPIPPNRRQFRPDVPPVIPTLRQVRDMCAEVTAPAHFYVGATLELNLRLASVEESWEIFQGRLLDPSQTRQRRSFESWDLFLRDAAGPLPEPLLSVKLDAEESCVHVVRAVHCHVWEGYDAGGNVFRSRETTKWVRELAGTIPLAGRDTTALRAELVGLLFRAVVGASRLPLTSLEAPLPAYSLGQFGYFYRHDASVADPPLRTAKELASHGLVPEMAWLEKVKLLELVLRAETEAELPEAAGRFVERWQEIGHALDELPALFRALFDEAALSPWTDFVETTLTMLRLLVTRGNLTVEGRIDFLGYLLRQLGRHLTAYDLVTFHHFGANYPDALLLDTVLKDYLELVEDQPALFRSCVTDSASAEKQRRLRRRALRQGCYSRRHYQGHPVPDAPTSPGENARVLPPPFIRVPDEQIVNPLKRTRKLYDGDPLERHLGEQARQVLHESLRDLEHPAELRELGMALFLDRPLGVFKPPTEPDRTLLFSYEAFSRIVAERRLKELGQAANVPESFDRLAIHGIPLEPAGRAVGPRIVSLDDAFKVAPDFVLLRSTRRSVREFLDQFDFTPLGQQLDLDYLSADRRLLIVRAPDTAGVLWVFDAERRKRLELQVPAEGGYVCQADAEVPRDGLRVLRAWDREGKELEVAGMLTARLGGPTRPATA